MARLSRNSGLGIRVNDGFDFGNTGFAQTPTCALSSSVVAGWFSPLKLFSPTLISNRFVLCRQARHFASMQGRAGFNKRSVENTRNIQSQQDGVSP